MADVAVQFITCQGDVCLWDRFILWKCEKSAQFIKFIVSEPSAVFEVVRDTAVIYSLWC